MTVCNIYLNFKQKKNLFKNKIIYYIRLSRKNLSQKIKNNLKEPLLQVFI